VKLGRGGSTLSQYEHRAAGWSEFLRRDAVELRDGPDGASLVMRMLLSRKLLITLVVLGAFFRIYQYASDRSLWYDEALTALNLIDRSLAGLTQTLDFNQGAPFGFLVGEHVASQLFGFSEYALRLLPLLASLAALALFAVIAKRILIPLTVPLAVLLFSTATAVIYYASEVKAYSFDVAAGLLLLTVGVSAAERHIHVRSATVLGLAGGIAVLASNAAVFVAAGVVIVLAGRAWRRPQWAHLRSLGPLLVLWAGASVATILFALTRLSHVKASLDSSRVGGGSGVVEGNGFSLDWLTRLGTDLAAAMGLPQTAPYTTVEKVAFAFAAIGLLSFLLRNRTHAAMLALPMVLTVLAWAAGEYPLTLRTTLFLVPFVILALAEGFGRFLTWLRPPWSGIAATLLILPVVAYPSWTAFQHVVHPQKHEEIKPLLTYMRDHWESGDALFVQHDAQYALRYYLECHCFRTTTRDGNRWLGSLEAAPSSANQNAAALRSASPTIVIGGYHPFDGIAILSELTRLRGRPRVWVLVSHTASVSELKLLTEKLPRYLDSIGRRLAEKTAPRAHLYLYDLR
jgi:uncharacterized membrane protein